MTIQAKIIEDSISLEGVRLTTFQLMYPRFIHSELLTHRVFSRNASSSRAIPVSKMIAMVREEPTVPIHWGKNQPGMQAKEELGSDVIMHASELWISASNRAADIAQQMLDIGLHKQVANRIMEPFQHISVVLTATEWENFFELRNHPDAQPEIQELARRMHLALGISFPKTLIQGEWHLPYVTKEDIDYFQHTEVSRDSVKEKLLKVSAARCCRVSYLKHDGGTSSFEEDVKLCDRLAASRPIHASPFEHQATPIPVGTISGRYFSGGWNEIASEFPLGVSHVDSEGNAWSGNFKGWIQQRKLIEASFND